MRRDPNAAAHYAVKRALATGRLVRSGCVVCGRQPTDAHHEDYAKPLEVIWLCRMHHRWRHHYGHTIAHMVRTFQLMPDYWRRAA